MTDKQPTSDTPDKLDSILDVLSSMIAVNHTGDNSSASYGSRRHTDDKNVAGTAEAIRQWISDAIRDEPEPGGDEPWFQGFETRNQLRQQIRNKLGIV